MMNVSQVIFVRGVKLFKEVQNTKYSQNNAEQLKTSLMCELNNSWLLSPFWHWSLALGL